MFYWTYGLLLLLLLWIHQSYCNNQPRIVNGNKVTPGSGKWPFIAAIMKPNKKGEFRIYCGGTVLNQDTILTAAHCLIGISATNLSIFVGHESLKELRENRKGYMRRIKKFISHPKFSTENDIALLKLESRLEFENLTKVEPVCLPNAVSSDDNSLYDMKNCMVMGWGKNQNLKTTVMLNDVEIPILDNQTCTKYQVMDKPYNPESMICAGYLEGMRDTCTGDSGGPLLCPYKANKNLYAQLGIVSFGNGCAKANNPGYYTKVSSFLDWVKTGALGD